MAIVIVRTFIIYFAIMLTMRLLGKRQLGEMELSEFVVAALIADLAAHPLQDVGIPLINGLIPVMILFCCEVIIAGLTMQHIRLRNLFFGKPSILIARGKIIQQEMRKNRFTVDELFEEMRAQGSTDISKIEYGILETNGKLSILPYPNQRPATAAQLNLDAGEGGYPSIVISDGRILDSNLRLLGFDRAWLEKQLQSRGQSSAEKVFLMTATPGGKIYFVEKEKKV